MPNSFRKAWPQVCTQHASSPCSVWRDSLADWCERCAAVYTQAVPHALALVLHLAAALAEYAIAFDAGMLQISDQPASAASSAALMQRAAKVYSRIKSIKVQNKWEGKVIRDPVCQGCRVVIWASCFVVSLVAGRSPAAVAA